MSSVVRKLERNIIKNKITKDGRSVKKCFEQEWADFREKKYVIKDEDGNTIADNTPVNTMRKKQNHFDNVEQYNRLFAYIKSLKNDEIEEAAKSNT